MNQTDSGEATSSGTSVRLSKRFALDAKDLLVILCVTVLIGFWVIARGNHASGGLLGRPLRVGIVQWPGYAGGLVANNGLRPNKDSDFWKNHNLLVEFVLVENEDELRQEFVRGGENGGLDVVWSTVDSLAHQFSSFVKDGVQPRAVLQVDWSRGGDAIVANVDIRRVEDLKGKAIAVSMAPSQWLLEYSLENSSLTEPERTAIQMTRHRTGSSQQAREEFEDRKVDAAVLWEPDVSEALRQRNGSHILVDTTMATNLIADVMVAKEDFIRDHHDVIAAFIEGWLLDGTTKALNDPMLATKVLQDEPDFEKLGEAKTRALLGKVALATLKDNVRMFGLSSEDALFDHLFSRATNLWLKRGYISTQTQAEEARDVELLKEIYNAQAESAGIGCDPILMTKEVTITFQPHSAELGPEARRTLDDEEVSLLLRAISGARFCIQVVGDDAYGAPAAPDMAEARANSVIDYLAWHYGRPRSQFASAGSGTYDTPSSSRSTPYIRLKLISPSHAGDGANGNSTENEGSSRRR